MEELLADLCTFCNGDELPAVVQAAIAHAQFETIHPFVDGNGRQAGRSSTSCFADAASHHECFRPSRSSLRRGRAPTSMDSPPPAIAAERTSLAAYEGLNRWVGLFASACSSGCVRCQSIEDRIRALQRLADRGRSHTSGSAVDLLVRAMPGAPIVTVSAAAMLIGRSFQATNEAMRRLANAGVLSQVNVGRRNRAFEAADLISVFTDLERQLAGPLVARCTRRPLGACRADAEPATSGNFDQPRRLPIAAFAPTELSVRVFDACAAVREK